MATTTTTDADQQNAEQIKAQIKSDILLVEYGIIDEFRQQQYRKVKELKTMPDGTKKWVRRPYWYLPKDQRPAPTNENEIP